MTGRHSRALAGLLLLTTALSFSPADGLQVSGIYSYRVPVSNDSDAERNRAFREALEAVVLKVTGERRWLEHPVIQQAIDNAPSYVEAISYSSEQREVPLPASDTDSAEPQELEQDQEQNQEQAEVAAEPASQQPILTQTVEQRVIDVDFGAGLINELLRNAQVPVWDSNRPSVLVWMVLQDDSGTRNMLTSDSNPEIIAYIQAFAARRAIPIIFPLLDFEDRRSLGEDELWALDAAAIARASERYGADSVLAGRLLFSASGELVGLWQFQFQDQAQIFDGFDEELDAYLQAPLDRVTSQLASYFAIVPETATTRYVKLRVEGIGDLRAYSALLAYVSNLGLVQSVSTAELDGERLELQLGLLGDARQLHELIALDRDLLPIRDTAADAETMLHYRWTR